MPAQDTPTSSLISRPSINIFMIHSMKNGGNQIPLRYPTSPSRANVLRTCHRRLLQSWFLTNHPVLPYSPLLFITFNSNHRPASTSTSPLAAVSTSISAIVIHGSSTRRLWLPPYKTFHYRRHKCTPQLRLWIQVQIQLLQIFNYEPRVRAPDRLR